MAANKHLPHILVIPEDDANRQIANGFIEDEGLIAPLQIQVLPVAGGWVHVVKSFLSDQMGGMEAFAQRFAVLLVDFDDRAGRRAEIMAKIPDHLVHRVFVLGVLSNPEILRTATGMRLEKIGSLMAQDCREETRIIWSHELLQNNGKELERLRQAVVPFLFGQD